MTTTKIQVEMNNKPHYFPQTSRNSVSVVLLSGMNSIVGVICSAVVVCRVLGRPTLGRGIEQNM